MGVRRYEDLQCWRLANELKRRVYAVIAVSTRIDLDFRDQIVDSACSAPRNIAEGFGRYRHREFAQFLAIAKGSLSETHNHIADGFDRGYWSASERDTLQQIANEASKATASLIRYLRRTRDKD